ncbi:MAG TPA: SIMPL domain-containing protein [Anaerolineales bacterium]|nr:SIMPL domain-containing protein [Anaerolineales bacterium]
MKRTPSLILVLLVAALALGACAPSTVVANAVPPQRLVNVTGTGTVYLKPDVAYLNIGVHTELATAAEAVADNNQQTQKVIAALKTFGLKEADIRTAYFSIYPSVQYDPQTSERRGTTYVVDNSVYVTVRDIEKLGDLLDATLSAGANSVNSIQFDVEDKSAATKEARDAAVKDAQQQADELAAAAGIKLGDLQRIDFYSSVPPQIFSSYGKGGGGGAEASSVPIQTGQLTITATVSVSYEIK